MITKTKLKKGDNVIVLTGKDKGKTGSILSIFSKKNKAIVKGINVVKKHQKPTKQSGGGIIDKELSIHLSNLSILDSKNNKTLISATSVGKKNKDKKKSEKSAEVAQILIKKALEKKITNVYLDRGGYRFHGWIKSLADAIRNGGIRF